MRWLFVTTVPWPLTNGTALRVWHLARTLRAQGDQVTLLTSCREGDFASHYAAAGIAVRLPAGPAEMSRPAWLWPFDRDASLSHAVAEATAGDEFEAVVLAGGPALQYAADVLPGPLLVADVIDDMVLAMRRQLWRGPRPMMWLRRSRQMVEFRIYEKSVRRRLDLATFVSEADAASFGRRHPGLPTATSPNGVDLDYFSTARPAAGAAESSQSQPGPGIVFVGNFVHVPNLMAAEFLVRKIAPLVWRSCPAATFYLVGPNPPPDWLAWPQAAAGRLVVTGLADDVRGYLRSAAAVALPMVSGTGIKNKLLEAWGCACPVVATRLACQGVPAEQGVNLLMADEPADFAAAALRLINDPALGRRLGAAGRAAVEAGFSWQKIAADFRQLVTAARG